jgi:hypothetical protein
VISPCDTNSNRVIGDKPCYYCKSLVKIFLKPWIFRPNMAKITSPEPPNPPENSLYFRNFRLKTDLIITKIKAIDLLVADIIIFTDWLIKFRNLTDWLTKKPWLTDWLSVWLTYWPAWWLLSIHFIKQASVESCGRENRGEEFGPVCVAPLSTERQQEIRYLIEGWVRMHRLGALRPTRSNPVLESSIPFELRSIHTLPPCGDLNRCYWMCLS